MPTHIHSRIPAPLAFVFVLILILAGAAVQARGEDPPAPAQAQFQNLHISAGELVYDEAADSASALDGVVAAFAASIPFTLRTPAMDYQPEAGILSATQGVIIDYGATDTVRLTAEALRYERELDTLTLSGNVRAVQDEWVFTADRLMVNRGAGTFSAPGPVAVVYNDETIQGRDLSYDRNTRQGELLEAGGCYRGVNIKGDRLAFATSGVTFFNAVATTCSFGSMDYHIRARSVTVTRDNKAHFRRIEVFVKSRRVFKWKSYVMAFGNGAPTTEPSEAAGGLRIKPASLGYNDVGGAFVRTGITYPTSAKSSMELVTHYYLLEGFFPQFEARRTRGRTNGWFKLGKEFKENTGYFRYLSPVVVWNQPTAGLDFGTRLIPGTRALYNFSAEAGQLKEAHLSKSKSRVYGKFYARYPLNPKQPVVFSLVSDVRYGAYTGWRKYRVAGAGLSLDFVHGGNAKHVLGLQFLHFDQQGRTFFVSDLVDTNDKLYFAAGAKITQKSRVRLNGEYDLYDRRFDEVEYLYTRTYECVSLDLGFRKELQSVLFRVNVIGLQNKKPRPLVIQKPDPESALEK